MLGQRSIYHDGWLASHRAPAAVELGQLRQGRVGAVPPRDRSLPVQQRGRRPPRAARGAEEPVVLLRRHLQRPAARRPLARSSRSSPSGPAARPTATSTSSTRTAPTCPSRPARRSPGARTRSRPASRVDSADVEGVIWAAGGVPGGHSLYVKDGKLRYTFNWIGTVLQDVVADAGPDPGRTRAAPPSSPPTGPSTDPDMPGTAGTLTLYVDDRAGRHGQIVTQPGYFCLTGDGICVGRDSASAVTPEYAGAVPLHRRHDRQGRRRRVRRALRRPRGPGARLVQHRLDVALPPWCVRGQGSSRQESGGQGRPQAGAADP